MTSVFNDIPTPNDKESCENYSVRAHKALLRTIPDPDERNAVVKNTWRQHRGEVPGERVAASKFAADRFDKSEDHCVFVENETTGKDGQPRKYTLTELKEIVRQHNGEIEDIGAFPAITSHHTPDEPDGKQPDVLGFSGPFRIGMVGRNNPRWAIFADEHRHRGNVEAFTKNPYRSVELWSFKDGRKRFHPIAVTGAEAPRLLMPAKYTIGTDDQGGEVEKFTISTAAFAGGSNTFTKSDREKFSQQPQQPIGGSGMLSPQDIAAIMQALAATPQFVFLTRLMEEDEAAAGAGDGMGAPGMDMDADSMGDGLDADPDAMGDDMQLGPGEEDEFDAGDSDEDDDLADGDDDTELYGDSADSTTAGKKPSKAPPVYSGEDEDKEPFTMTVNRDAMVEKFTELQRENAATVEKYTALQQSHDALIEKYKGVHDRLAVVEKVGVDASRKAKIAELVGKYTMALDQEELEKECLFAHGSEMTDDEFTKHVAVIEKFGAKFEESPMIPRGALPERFTNRSQTDVEKYNQRVTQEALKFHSDQQAAGKHPTWQECEAEAEKRIKSNGHAAAAV